MSATNREGGGVGSRVGSGQALRGSGRVGSDNYWLLKSGRVGSRPWWVGSGPKNWTREQLCSFLHRDCTRAALSVHHCVILVLQHYCNSATVLLQVNDVKYKLN